MIAKLILDITVLITVINGSCSKEYKESLHALKKQDLIMLKESYLKELSIVQE